MTKDEALKEALANYMAAFGQALEAHGIPYGQQQIDADKQAREALAQPDLQPLTDDEIETLIQTKHFRPGYFKHRSDLVILDWYRLGLRDGEAAHGTGKKT
jgi:hypothetical protein